LRKAGVRSARFLFAIAAIAGCTYAPRGAALAQTGAPGPDANAAHARPTAPLNTIREVFAALEACWIPPDLDDARPGMQITVMLSFKRNGELLGEPRITYETRDASAEERTTYRLAVGQALARCTPLPFTEALGNALAGRPMTMRFIDNRKLKQARTNDGRPS
jgi:hypothetical protein